MTLVEKILALKSTPPFDRLDDHELAVIAAVVQERAFRGGETIHAGPEPFPRFLLLAGGGWESAAGPLARTLGVGSVLFNLPAAGPVVAAPAGAICLVISRRHFHTIASACPELILGYLAERPLT